MFMFLIMNICQSGREQSSGISAATLNQWQSSVLGSELVLGSEPVLSSKPVLGSEPVLDSESTAGWT